MILKYGDKCLIFGNKTLKFYSFEPVFASVFSASGGYPTYSDNTKPVFFVFTPKHDVKFKYFSIYSGRNRAQVQNKNDNVKTGSIFQIFKIDNYETALETPSAITTSNVIKLADGGTSTDGNMAISVSYDETTQTTSEIYPYDSTQSGRVCGEPVTKLTINGNEINVSEITTETVYRYKTRANDGKMKTLNAGATYMIGLNPTSFNSTEKDWSIIGFNTTTKPGKAMYFSCVRNKPTDNPKFTEIQNFIPFIEFDDVQYTDFDIG